MLKIRILPTLLYKDFGLVKGVGFDSWRRVGAAMQTVKVFNLREVDEMVLLDITATHDGRSPDFEMVDEIADECFMPLAVGGGVRSVEDVRHLLQVGADKVVINTAAHRTPGLVKSASRLFGSQCIMASIDFRMCVSGYEVFINSGRYSTGLDPLRVAMSLEEEGAGEILLTSIERDGTMEGYDVELTRRVCDAVSIPVIASGGAGNYSHIHQVITDGKASAAAAASMFHFTEQTPLEAKQYLKERGVNVRL